MAPIQRCKLCGMNLEAEAWGGIEKGFYRMRCRRCGEYEMTVEAYQDIEEQSPFLQAAARQEFAAGRRLRISNDNWQRLHLGNAETAGYIARSGTDYSLTAKGWDYLYGGTGTGAIPGRCFVAMSFSDEHSAIYTEGIKPAVQAAGYDPVWMKDVLTNEDINYRMISEIRKSQFLVADFTGLKGGVYFEAGFALGLGRNVFWTTRASDLPNIHFDTNHYQHIVWKTHDELRDQLREKIIALLGFGTRRTMA